MVALIPSSPSIPSFNLATVIISELPSLAVTLNETLSISSVNKGELLLIVKIPLEIVRPLSPFVTIVQSVPPSVLYCHFPKVQLVYSGVKTMLEGEYSFEPLLITNKLLLDIIFT